MNEQSAVNPDQGNSQQTQSIFADIPLVDDVDLPDEDQETVDESAQNQGGDEVSELDEKAGEADEPNTKIEIDGETVTVDEIKELKQLKQAYTQQRQSDTEHVRQVQTQALEAVSSVQENAAQQLYLIKQSVRQLIAPGVTPEYLMQLAYQDPQAAQQLQARLNALDLWEKQVGQVSDEFLTKAQQAKQAQSQQASQFQQQTIQTEAQKLAGKTWYTPEFQQQALAFAVKHGIPKEEAASIQRSGAIEILRKAMLYDKAMTNSKNKQTQTSAVTPGSRAANGRMADQKSFKTLEARAKSGDKAAMGAYARAVIPVIK